MSMSKKDFIVLADVSREANSAKRALWNDDRFDCVAVQYLSDFCATQNPRFDRQRWLGYIAGEYGPNGRRVKK